MRATSDGQTVDFTVHVIINAYVDQPPYIVNPVQAAPAAAAPAAKPAGAGEKVASPLPGVIIEISVKEGQQVKAGQKVAILEAMKMENEIPAPKDGTITDIHVHKGDTLQEGDPVVTIA